MEEGARRCTGEERKKGSEAVAWEEEGVRNKVEGRK